MDFCCGADQPLVHVSEVLSREPLDGWAYVLRNHRASHIKVLVVDAQGVWSSARRYMKDGSFAVDGRDAVAAAPSAVFMVVHGSGLRLSAPMPLERRL